MTNPQYRGRWGQPPEASTEPVEPREELAPLPPTLITEAPQRAARPIGRAGFRALAPQIARAVHGLKKKHGIGNIAKACDVTTNTIRSAMSGVGMKLSTLEKLADVAGWSVEIRDEKGTLIVRS